MNVKEEFIEDTYGYKVKCVYINIHDQKFILKLGYNNEDYIAFLNSINIEYFDGYGIQNLYGTIWCEDGIWFDRAEYDGAENWEFHRYPNYTESVKSVHNTLKNL